MNSSHSHEAPEIAGPILFHVDEVGAVVRGWAFDVRDPTPARIALWIDGVERAQFQADGPRNDLRALGYRDGLCAFRYALPDSLLDDADHDIMLTLGPEQLPMLPSPVRIRLPRTPPTPVEGHVDAIDPLFCVTGWVAGAEGRAVDILADGVVVASGRATLSRPDLRLAGRAGDGFRIRIDPQCLMSPTSTVTARCDGVPLAGSVVFDAAAAARLEAATCESAIDVRLTGWPGRAAVVEVLVDGEHAANLQLDRATDPAVLSATWALPARISDGRPHVIQVRGTGALAGVLSDASITRPPDLRMHIDRIEHGRVVGWAVYDGVSRPLHLRFEAEGLPALQVVAEGHRDDVATALGLSQPRVGFDVDFGAPLVGRTVHVVDVESNRVVMHVHVDDPIARFEGILRSSGQAASTIRDLRSRITHAMPAAAVVTARVPPLPVEADDVVDVVVPVYSGAAETVECIESVLASGCTARWRLVLVNDCSPDPRITAYLRRVAREHSSRVVLVEKPRNGGFSESVNLGMIIAGRRNVILLNADTVVHGDWIDRILAIAASDPSLATITPLSSNGEICSLPYLCKSVPVGDASELAELDDIAATNPEARVDIPVAVGYCMFIRRACLDEIGLFDAATWGRGYGEEVDFCMKASAAGWTHALAANVFVVHRGGVSFGDEKVRRIEDSARKIAERYPFYDGMIQAFLRRDPPARVRRFVNVRYLAQHIPADAVLHVTHAFGGGTARYVSDLSALYRRDGRVNLVLEMHASGASELRIETGGWCPGAMFQPTHVERYDADEHDRLAADLAAFDPARVHVHAPFGLGRTLYDWIRSRSDMDVTVHDYAWVCPQVTLTDVYGNPCCDGASPCPGADSPHPGLARLFHDYGGLDGYRRACRELLAAAGRTFVAGEDVRARLQAAGVEARYRVVDHPAGAASRATVRRSRRVGAGAKITVLCIGAISAIKGSRLLADCAREAVRMGSRVEFVLCGTADNEHELRSLPNVRVMGAYRESELATLIRHIDADIAFFPNRWPETFSYTLSAAFDAGLPALVADVGVPAERVRRSGAGIALPMRLSPAEIVHVLEDAARSERGIAPPPVYATTIAEYRGDACCTGALTATRPRDDMEHAR